MERCGISCRSEDQMFLSVQRRVEFLAFFLPQNRAVTTVAKCIKMCFGVTQSALWNKILIESVLFSVPKVNVHYTTRDPAERITSKLPGLWCT